MKNLKVDRMDNSNLFDHSELVPFIGAELVLEDDSIIRIHQFELDEYDLKDVYDIKDHYYKSGNTKLLKDIKIYK